MKKYLTISFIFILLPIACFAVSEWRRGISSTYIEYEDEKVTLDIYNPESKKSPVVILIHGAAGIEGDRADRYKGFATDLMNKGMIAINVHYFESKRKNWTKTIIKAIDYAETISNVDKTRVGVVGYSLGGTIALKVASSDRRVKLLAISAGYLPGKFTKENAMDLPDTYMISGTKDSAINTLYKLKEWFGESDKNFRFKINEGWGHSMPIDLFKKNWLSIVNFFKKGFNIRYY